MVVRGDVEFLDLSGKGRECLKPQNFPGGVVGPTGFYEESINSVIICGGRKADGIETNECHTYIPGEMIWIPSTPMMAIR